MQSKGFNPSIVPHRIDLVGIEGKSLQQQHINWLKSV
jgi:putative endonuclease